jgi:hypothetical protein
MTDEVAKPAGRTGRWVIWSFAALGVVAAISVIFLAVMVFSFTAERGAPAQVAGKTASEQYSVQGVEEIDGTNLFKVEIGIGDRGGGSYSSRGVDLRNLILLDKSTGANRRLLPGNDRHVVDTTFLPAAATGGAFGVATEVTESTDTPAGTKKAPPPPMAYYVVEVRQKEGVLQDVLVGNLAGGSQAWLLTGIDGADKMWMISPTRLGMLLRQGMKLQYRVIDIPTLKIVTATAVDIG